MADPFKPIGVEATLTTASNINLASLVRVVNLDGANSATITITSSTGTVLGTFTLGHHGTGFSTEYVVKNPTDTLKANNQPNNGSYAGAGVFAVAAAYR